MKTCIIRSVLASFLILLISSLYSQSVIRTLPTPGTKCQDVTWDGESIWVPDNTTRTYYKLDPADGSVLTSFPFPPLILYSEGITFDGQNLWVTGWWESNGNKSYIFKIKPTTGEWLEYFTYPGGENDNWPHGLTYDGTYLWSNNFQTKTLDKINPANGELVSTLPAPSDASVGIAWDGQYFWTNDYAQHLIFKQDPANGDILGSFSVLNTNTRGMEWDGQYLWTVSWAAQTIYQIDVGPLAVGEHPHSILSVYPNPGTGIFFIEVTGNAPANGSLEVVDLNGRIIQTMTLNGSQAFGQPLQLDMGDARPGVYVIKMNAQGNMWQEKIIIP
jgi:DNA-binding beta-propeller fold protein YncE